MRILFRMNYLKPNQIGRKHGRLMVIFYDTTSAIIGFVCHYFYLFLIVVFLLFTHQCNIFSSKLSWVSFRRTNYQKRVVTTAFPNFVKLRFFSVGAFWRKMFIKEIPILWTNLRQISNKKWKARTTTFCVWFISSTKINHFTRLLLRMSLVKFIMI